jgi:hypothetical protein
MGDNDRVNVRVSSDDIGMSILVLGLLVLCWGDPDLLDVLAKWCSNYMERNP